LHNGNGVAIESLQVLLRKAHGVASCDTTPPRTAQRTTDRASADAGPPLRAQSPEDLPFSQLLESGRARDADALSLLYRRFLPVIYRFLHSRTGNTALAEDLTSDTFFAIMESLDTLRAQDELGFATWALGIARNKLAMHFRRVKSRPEVSIESAVIAEPTTVAEEADPLLVLTARERWADVVSALNRLTPEQRETLWRRCLLGQSADEVAQVMGKPTNAIYGLQFRALAALVRYLKDSDQPDRYHDAEAEERRERSAGYAARREV
jgi:RNA polymerase sigma-70 factor, ECF subfamily